MRGYASNFSSSDDGMPSAPLPPSTSEVNNDTDYIAPRWVQRIYGPPPQAMMIPQPATVFMPAAPATAIPVAGGGYIIQPNVPVVHPGPYQVHAYTPGALPPQAVGGGCIDPAAMDRVRSPSTSTGIHAACDEQPENEYIVQGSPTKTPLFSPAHRPSDGDIEANNTNNNSTFADPTMPSRNVALRERRKKQLRTCDKDSFGVPLPNTRRPFSLFASPFNIAEVCTGLGVYLASLQATVLLALILSIACIYPLVDNVKKQQWSRDYTLITGKGGDVAGTCPKGWDLTSWLTSTTIGGHCNGGAYTSKYDCAAQCVWSPDRLNQAQCRGVKPPGIEMVSANSTTSNQYKSSLSGKCAQHLPCVKGRLDPNAPDGPCLCCQMQQDPVATAENPRVSAGQLWTFFIIQLIFMVWLSLYLTHTQLKAVHIQGTRVVGASDYSAWISGIPKTRAEDSPLAHWCSQFGPVVSAFNIPSVGDALRVGRRVADLQVQKAESDALEGSTSWNPLQWLYKVIAVGKPKALEEKLDRQQRKLVIYERQESEPTGQGLVTFEFSENAAAAISAFDRPPIRKLINWATLGLTNNSPRLHGAVVNVDRAPEPSDILWEHTNCTGTPALFRRIWSWTLTACIIMAGAGIQYGLAVAAERLREDRMMAQYAAGTGQEWAVEQAAAKTAKLRAITFLSAVVVVTINFAIMLTVRALSWYERWTTRTSMERWVMLKLSISQLCNAFAAPMLAAYASGNRSGWFSRGGLVEAAFYVQCANACVPPLFHLLGLGDKLKYYVLSPYARTQPMLNRLLAPPLFPMAEQHAASVTTLGLAMWYMPVLPMSPMIALIGLSISYCANKWIALRRAAAPPNLSGMVTAPLNWLLRLLPLIQMILMKQLYFYDYPTIDPVFYTGLAFWILFTLAPIRAFLGAVRRRRRTNASSGLSYHRLLGGKRLGVGDVYAPLVPKPCSRKFKERVASTFAQLAPAAFETILNGEEIAKFLFGGPGGEMTSFNSEKLAALGLGDPLEFPGAVSEAKIKLQTSQNNSEKKEKEHPTLRASIAGTLALLWNPADADHPDDVFLNAADAARRSANSGTNGSIPTASAPAPPPNNGYGFRQSQPRSVSASASDSCDPEAGGGGGGNTVDDATTPIARVRGPLPTTSTPGSSAFIPAVRHRTPAAATQQQNLRIYDANTPAVPSRLGPRRAPQQQVTPGGDALENFRPLGAGLSTFFSFGGNNNNTTANGEPRR